MQLAIDTGQRQVDLLVLPWSAFDGHAISLRQKTTKAWVEVPCTQELCAVLEAAPRRSTLMLTNRHGMPWSPSGFRTSWSKAAKAAGIKGLTFNDLRDTATSRLADAGCTASEIASITGHTLMNAPSILQTNRDRTDEHATTAIEKLDNYRRRIMV